VEVKQASKPKPRQHFFDMYSEVFKYLWRHPYILMCIFIKFTVWIPVGIIDLMNVRFAQTEFVIGKEGVVSIGITYMTVGLGTMITPMITRRFGKATPRGIQLIIVLAFFQLLVGCVAVSLAPGFVAFLLANLIRSGGTSVTMIHSSLILQDLVPAEFRGRVFSLEALFLTISECSSQIFAALVTDQAGWTLRQADAVAAIAAGVILPFWALYFGCATSHVKQAYAGVQSLSQT